MRWSTCKFGAIAQLGERNAGSVEVIGSIPISSTKFCSAKKADLKGWPFLFVLPYACDRPVVGSR